MAECEHDWREHPTRLIATDPYCRPLECARCGAKSSAEYHDALDRAACWADFVWLMKVPEQWVRFRVDIAHPSERAMLRAAARWEESA